MRGSKVPVGTIKQWTVQRSTKAGYVRVRNFIKVDDRATKIVGHDAWMSLARFNWTQANGNIPLDSEVIHLRAPEDMIEAGLPANVHGPRLPKENVPVGVYGPFEIAVDDVENLVLVPRGGLVQKILINPKAGKKQRVRRAVAVARSNQRRCSVRNAAEILPHRWYPVRTDAKVVVMQSRRTCKAVKAEYSEKTGAGTVIAVKGARLLQDPYDGYRREIPEEIQDKAV